MGRDFGRRSNRRPKPRKAVQQVSASGPAPRPQFSKSEGGQEHETAVRSLSESTSGDRIRFAEEWRLEVPDWRRQVDDIKQVTSVDAQGQFKARVGVFVKSASISA